MDKKSQVVDVHDVETTTPLLNSSDIYQPIPVYVESDVKSYAAPVVQLEEPELIEVNVEMMNPTSEENLRSALMAEVTKHCCWGKHFGEDSSITDIQELSAYHCIWETWVEYREVKNESKPYYNNTKIDPPGSGPVFGAWDLKCSRPNEFSNKTIKMILPHTDVITSCSSCGGRGQVQCNSCNGRGRKRCTSCNGSGRRRINDHYEQCHFCNGAGTKSCSFCHGYGVEKCKTCAGQGRLVAYRVVEVTFENRVHDIVLDISQLPSQFIQSSSGECILSQKGSHLMPPRELPFYELVEPLNILFQQAETDIHDGNVYPHLQRITIRRVPVTRARASLKDTAISFWVYGNDRACYVPDYPNKYCGCCGCSVL